MYYELEREKELREIDAIKRKIGFDTLVKKSPFDGLFFALLTRCLTTTEITQLRKKKRTDSQPEEGDFTLDDLLGAAPRSELDNDPEEEEEEQQRKRQRLKRRPAQTIPISNPLQSESAQSILSRMQKVNPLRQSASNTRSMLSASTEQLGSQGFTKTLQF